MGRGKYIRRADMALILVCLAAALVFGGYGLFSRQGGQTVEVTVDGKPYASLPSSEDKVLRIDGDNGSYNLVEISGGRARMEDAGCPDRLCVHMGWIQWDGQTVTCLPNKVILMIRGRGGDIDAQAR